MELRIRTIDYVGMDEQYLDDDRSFCGYFLYSCARMMAVFSNSEAEGYQFGTKGSGGVAVFDSTFRLSSELYNEIALGFMTWSKNGTLLRLSSSSESAHYFSIALVRAECVPYVL